MIKIPIASHLPNTSAYGSIHEKPCEKCPSAHYQPDQEAIDYMNAPKHIKLIYGIFPCAWRPNKLCKGVCDNLNINKHDLNFRNSIVNVFES